MVTQIEVVEKILTELGTGKMTLVDAVAKAEATKPLKNKNKLKNWENHFKTHGVVTESETGTFVSGKVVVTPSPVVEPVTETPKTQ